jgi:hypothetical protein
MISGVGTSIGWQVIKKKYYKLLDESQSCQPKIALLFSPALYLFSAASIAAGICAVQWAFIFPALGFLSSLLIELCLFASMHMAFVVLPFNGFNSHVTVFARLCGFSFFFHNRFFVCSTKKWPFLKL